MTREELIAAIDQYIVSNGNLKAINLNPLLKEIVNLTGSSGGSDLETVLAAGGFTGPNVIRVKNPYGIVSENFEAILQLFKDDAVSLGLIVENQIHGLIIGASQESISSDSADETNSILSSQDIEIESSGNCHVTGSRFVLVSGCNRVVVLGRSNEVISNKSDHVYLPSLNLKGAETREVIFVDNTDLVVGSTEYLIKCKTDSSRININLPSAVDNSGRTLIIMDSHGGALDARINIIPFSGDTIAGDPFGAKIEFAYGSITLNATGTNWDIISKI